MRRTAARRLSGRCGAVLGALLLLGGLAGCGRGQPAALTVRILAEHPHDPGAFTQGLLLDGGELYESTGQVGASSLREVDPATGTVIRQRDIPRPYFAEGLARVDGTLYQLTWQAGTAFAWERDTFNPVRSFAYQGEGWGLCFDGTSLYMSDGSDLLTRRDPGDFSVRGTVRVTRDGAGVDRLNELECVGDSIYANVWLTDTIVRIDKDSGRVSAVIDASPLRARMPELTNRDAVLNGIAYDPEAERFFVTGKWWPKMFEVTFVPAKAN